MLSSRQNDYFGCDICPREPFLHRCTVQNLELPQRFLYALGALFVYETVRKQQHTPVARLLYLRKPRKEIDDLRRFEGRVGNDVLAAEIDVPIWPDQRLRHRIQACVKVRQLPVDFQSHDLRGMYACGDQGPGELSRTAADVHDTAVILEIPHGKGGDPPGRSIGRKVLRQADTASLLPLAQCVVGPVIPVVAERQFTVLLQVIVNFAKRIRPDKQPVFEIAVRKRIALSNFSNRFIGLNSI